MAAPFQPFALKQTPEQAAALEAAREAEFRVDLAIRLVCPSCPPDKPINIIEAFGDGDLVCGNCGLVLGDRVVDTRSEWRTFANEEGDDPSRVGSGTNALAGEVEELGLNIGFRDNQSGAAKDLKKAAQAIHHRSGDRSVGAGWAVIANQAELMGLPRGIADIAKQLYKRADEEKVLRGKPLDAQAAACIFIACRAANAARTFRELSRQIGVSRKDLATCYKILRLRLEGTGVSSLTGTEAEAVRTAGQDLSAGQIAASAEVLVNRFASNLALPAHVASAARTVANKVTNAGTLTGRNPTTVASAVLFFTSHLLGVPKSVADIAKIGGMAESTIKHAYKLMLPDAKDLIEAHWVADGRADLARLP